MARGGRRQGTPGVSYTNRTDLNVAHAPQQGTRQGADEHQPTTEKHADQQHKQRLGRRGALRQPITADEIQKLGSHDLDAWHGLLAPSRVDCRRRIA